MPVQCPECKATLEDPSAPCEWCGHPPPGAAAAEPPAEVDTAPPPPNYAERAQAEPVGVPTSEPSQLTAPAPPPTAPRPRPDAMRQATAKPQEAVTAPPPAPALSPPSEPQAAPSTFDHVTPPAPFARPAPPNAPPARLATPAPAPAPRFPTPAATPARPLATPAPAPAVTTAPVATKPVEPTGGLRQTREQILDGGDLDAGIALELDMGSSERASPEPASIRVAAAAAAPLARGPAPATPQLDPIEIRMVARFGATPDSWWATPSYVRLVRARQVELAKELTIAEQHYVAAKAALDDALVSIGQRAIAEVRNTVKGSRGSYLKTLDRLAKRETELKAIDTAVYEESEKHRDTMRTLFERIEATKTKLAASKGKDLTADLAALQQERDATERAMKMPTKSLDPEVERVRREFRATCADFAQFVLDDRANFSDDYEEPRARIARLRNAVDAEEKKVLLHDAASNAFDEKAMATGIRVMYGGIGLAVLSFVLLVLVLK